MIHLHLLEKLECTDSVVSRVIKIVSNFMVIYSILLAILYFFIFSIPFLLPLILFRFVFSKVGDDVEVTLKGELTEEDDDKVEEEPTPRALLFFSRLLRHL